MAISLTLVYRQTNRGYIANDFWASHAWCQVKVKGTVQPLE
jgi:hypothetical protein